MDDFSKFLENDMVAKIVGIVVTVQLCLYLFATALTKISVWTENKWDNKAAAYASQAAWFLGVFIGKFGYSTPKLVIEEKAKEINAGNSKPKAD